MKKPGSASSPLWYKDAVLYELHVRAFADSNGDGIGDFPGLLTKLDYLEDLGVTCLWLLPFFPSPLRDDGYDVADFTSVNPSYGTLDDFQRFLDAAHKRGMQVLIELVMNHTSDQHPWFQRARHAPAGSPERGFYVWNGNDTRFPDVPIIFKDTEKSNWTWDPVANAFFWHRFFSHQPDLNFDNPQVLEEMLNVMRFWLDRGVDGLRLDAIPYLIERDGTRCESLPETHAILRKMRAIVDAEYTNRFFLAEANQLPAEVRPYFGDGDECHMAFHFPLMPRNYVSLRQEDRLPIVDILQKTPPIPDSCQWGLFLRNHDELTLEMVTDDERDYMWLAYSADPRARVNVGIRRRLAPLLDNNRQRIELLDSLLFSFPGTPILYYGDEIGMGDNMDLGDRNGVRTPMQWSAERNGGFSTAPPEKLYFPIISDPVYGYTQVNVAEQQTQPSSLLQWTRNMIHLRKLFRVFGRGTLRFLHPANRKVLAYLRELDGDSVLCVANLSRFAQPVALDLAEHAGRIPMEVMGYNPFPAIAESPYVLSLAPYSFLWFELMHPPRAPQTTSLGDLNFAAAETATPAEVHLAENAPAASANAEFSDLLIHVSPQTQDDLRSHGAALQPLIADGARRLTLTFPWNPAIAGGGEEGRRGFEAELAELAPGITLAPYVPTAAHDSGDWLHSEGELATLAQLARERNARAAVLLTSADHDFSASLQALTAPLLQRHRDLAIANYSSGRFEGLFNSAVVRPLTRTFFFADLCFPLAPDIALSRALLDGFAQHEGSDAPTWPALAAVRSGSAVEQVPLPPWRAPLQPGADVSALLTRVLDLLFCEIEESAENWQRERQPSPVFNGASARNSPGVDDAAKENAPNVSPMLAAFRLGVTNLHEVWSQILSPATLLAVKRTAATDPRTFRFADALWVRVVYDFLAAYRSRTVSRAHIFGALVPIYMGWAAFHVEQVCGMSDAAAEQSVQGLMHAFEADKPYLLARWRWPDRFTP